MEDGRKLTGGILFYSPRSKIRRRSFVHKNKNKNDSAFYSGFMRLPDNMSGITILTDRLSACLLNS